MIPKRYNLYIPIWYNDNKDRERESCNIAVTAGVNWQMEQNFAQTADKFLHINPSRGEVPQAKKDYIAPGAVRLR